MTTGSLFDGAGTMPLAAKICGIEPVWASEIEPFPVKVTSKRFPAMRHLGDVTKIRGDKIEPVDVVTFGSPCQDLSVAGNRAGLDGERSGLFTEAVRIIKEMRYATANNDRRHPRFAVWENVPGAFSSRKGEDFRAVLEQLARIEDGNAVIPRPPRGKWADSGSVMGDGWSIAWRVLDAQFWGVPQRRRRIYLVADLGGRRAAEVLFERAGLSRSFASIRQAGQAAADHPDGRAAVSRQRYDARGNGDGDTCPTITGDHDDNVTDYTAVVIGTDIYNYTTTESKAKCLKAGRADSDSVPCVIYAKGTRPHNSREGQTWVESETANCLNIFDTGEKRANELIVATAAGKNGDQPLPCYAIDRAAFNQGENAQYDFRVSDDGIAQTLVAKGPGAVCYPKIARTLVARYDGSPDVDMHANIVFQGFTVRRLTPTECARLQGMPDWWCADVPHKDAPEYKMWGNGMALPNALYVMEGIKKVLTEEL